MDIAHGDRSVQWLRKGTDRETVSEARDEPLGTGTSDPVVASTGVGQPGQTVEVIQTLRN